MTEERRHLHLSRHAREHILKGRAVVQPPSPEEAARLRAVATEGHIPTVGGIPLDIAMTLEALRQLAEQGNYVAERLYEQERMRLGIDLPLIARIGEA